MCSYVWILLYVYIQHMGRGGGGGCGIVRASHAILGPGEILWMNDLIGKAN